MKSLIEYFVLDSILFLKLRQSFRTDLSYRFVSWLKHNMDVLTVYKASLGFIWA